MCAQNTRSVLTGWRYTLKTPRLALIGDKNFKKTSLVNVLLGLTHPEFVATLSKKKVFGTSMIDNDTMISTIAKPG